LNAQFIEVDTRAQDIDFEEFSMKQRHQKADEAAFKEDQDRKKWLKDEMTKEKTDLEKFNKEIKAAEDALAANKTLTQEQLAERQANNARLAEINKTLGGIDAEIAAFATKQEAAQKKRDDEEKARKEKEAVEEKRVAEENRVRAVNERKRQRENIEKGSKDMEAQKKKNKADIEKFEKEMQKSTLTQKEFLALEKKSRELIQANKKIEQGQKDGQAVLAKLKKEEDSYKAEEEKILKAKKVAEEAKWFTDYDKEVKKAADAVTESARVKALYDAAKTANDSGKAANSGKTDAEKAALQTAFEEQEAAF
jgi:hypothetical protein